MFSQTGREAAQAVAGAGLRELMALVNKSLIQRTADGRYQMHELLRQYAEERLNGLPDKGKDVRDRHAAYYAAAFARWVQDLKGPREVEARKEIEAEIANARAAWEWAAAQGQAEWLEQAIDGMGQFYGWRWHSPEGVEVFQAAAERLLAAHDGPQALSVHQQRVLARLWAWEGLLHRLLAHTEQAGQLWHQSQELLAQLESAGCDVRMEKAFVLRQVATLDQYYDDLTACRSRQEQSLALYRELGARGEAASVLCELGRTLHQLGCGDQAVQVQREALAMRRELGNPSGIVESLMCLSWMLVEQGDLSEAERAMRESLALARAMGDPSAIGDTLGGMYVLLRGQGRFAEAYSLAKEALAFYREQEIRYYAWIFVDISSIEVHLGRYSEARLDAETGLAPARKIGLQWQFVMALLLLGEAAMGEGALAEAGPWLQEALAAIDEPANRWMAFRAHAALGGVALLQGDLGAAQQHLGQALRQTPLFTLPFAARLLAQQGQAERAIEVYTLASRDPYVANSRWYQDLVGQYVEGVAETLPSDVVATAQERGRALDLQATVQELAAELERE